MHQLVPFLMVISQEISACQSTETCYITQIFFQILFEPDTTLNIVIFDSQPQILNGNRVKFKFGSSWALWGESGVIIILYASPHGFNNSYFGFLFQASIINGDLSYCVVQNFLQGSVFSPTKYPKIPFLFPATSDLSLLILLLSRAFRSVPAGGARYYAD